MKNIDIVSQLVALGIEPDQQSKYLVAAVARVVAYTAPLPSAPDETFFQTKVAPHIAGELDFYNEMIPLDFAGVTELAQRLWDVRYRLLFPSDMRDFSTLDLIANERHIDFGVLRTDPTLIQLTSIVAGD